jgi:hypothetical protein
MSDITFTTERASLLILIFLCQFRGMYLIYMSYAPRAIRTPGLGSRVISSLHCAIVVPLAVAYLYGELSEPDLLLGRYVTAGYLAHDLWLVLREPSLCKVEDIVHHIAFLVVLPAAYLYPHYYARGMLAEISLPFLYTSFFMIKTQKDKQYPKIFAAVSACGLITFLVFRVINFTYLMQHIYYHHTWLVVVAAAALTSLNYYWFYLLGGKAIQAISGTSVTC